MRKFILGTFIAFSFLSYCQAPFEVKIEATSIPNLGGLQSFAHGQSGGRWLLIGGRLDGLHRRQPFAAFDVAGNNNQLIVVDPSTKETWTAPLTTLSVSLREQLSSTNMEFHQEGDYLYLIGGYGYNATSAARKTFNNLTAVDVPSVIDAVINGTSFTNFFRQLTDAQFAVTGGHLEVINGIYHLLGGNQFDGDYNPMGNPTYTQVYTDAVRKFTISDDGTTITINHLAPLSDATKFHRRDYNAIPQILPDGSEGITMFSGVFQPTVDLPFLNSVTIDENNNSIDAGFQQYYNHYHCAVLPIYSISNNEMHNLFFGGIAQFYDNNGTLVQDNNVPFVKTIARVTRDQNGTLAEYKLPIEMPSFLGAGSELIQNQNTPHYSNGVLKLDEFTEDTTLVGYIFGGISSSAMNIFTVNNGTQSNASNQLFKVFIIKNATSGIDELNPQSQNSYLLQVFPNPNAGDFMIQFNLSQMEQVKISLYSVDGKKIMDELLMNLAIGENKVQRKLNTLEKGGKYILTFETEKEKLVRQMIIER